MAVMATNLNSLFWIFGVVLQYWIKNHMSCYGDTVGVGQQVDREVE